MTNKFIKLVIGDIEEKKAYTIQNKALKLRINALPNDYQIALKKMKKYLTVNGLYLDPTTPQYIGLIELFEVNALQNKTVTEVVGVDLAKFCDELLTHDDNIKQKLNTEIANKLGRHNK